MLNSWLPPNSNFPRSGSWTLPTVKIFLLGLYLKSSSALIGLLPLFAPTNVNHCSASVPSSLTPILLALLTLVVLASIQLIPEPVEASIWPEFPMSPVLSFKCFTFSNSVLPLNVLIPVTLKSRLANTP